MNVTHPFMRLNDLERWISYETGSHDAPQSGKLWIEQLDSAIHERPEQVLAAEIVRLQSEIDALKEQVRKLESAIDR